MLKIVGVDFTLCRPLWPADFSAGLAMYAGKVLVAQLMDFLPWTTFARLVLRYGGDTGVRNFPCTA